MYLYGNGSRERQNERTTHRKSDINSVSKQRRRHEGQVKHREGRFGLV